MAETTERYSEDHEEESQENIESGQDRFEDEEKQGGDGNKEEGKKGEAKSVEDEAGGEEVEEEEGPIIPESFYERARPDKNELLGRAFLLLQCTNGQVLTACDKLDGLANKTHPGISGLSIVQKDIVACILEAPSEVLSDFLAALDEIGHQKDAGNTRNRKGSGMKNIPESRGAWFNHVRVLNFVEGFPSRSYWSYMRTEVTPSKGSEVNLSEVDLSEFVFEMYSNFVSIGTRMRSKPNLRNIKELKQNFPDLIPAYERLAALVNAEHVLSIEDFVQLFHKPFTLQPIEDKTWPVHVVNDDLAGLLYM